MNNPNNKVFLVIKKTSWNDGENWFDVAEHSEQKERAEQCIIALNTLNDDKKVSYIVCEVANANKDAIFYIKYYAKKHDMVIERKATLDENCFEGRHKKFGYPYKKYIDVWATEEINNGEPQYRTASKKWEINQTQTLNQ